MELKTMLKQPLRGVPLLDYLAARFTYRPRPEWAALIEAGDILVNGRPATADTRLNTGDELTTILRDIEPPEVNYNYSIVFEDEWLLAVNKPAGLRVHGKGRYIQANLIHHLRYVHSGYESADLIHRIDANTSGLVLLAKDKGTMKVMQAGFREHRVRKTYLAWVHGRVAGPGRVINAAIGKIPSLEGVYRYGVGPAAINPKPSATRMDLVRAPLVGAPVDRHDDGRANPVGGPTDRRDDGWANPVGGPVDRRDDDWATTRVAPTDTDRHDDGRANPVGGPTDRRDDDWANPVGGPTDRHDDGHVATGETSIVRFTPYTGRTHQIRVHAAAIGHPLVGDQLYLMNDEDYLRWWKEPAAFETPLWPSHALHASELRFEHPHTGKWMTISAGSPDWLFD